MRTLVSFIFIGVLALVACKKNDDGGAAAGGGPAGYAATPQNCSTARYMVGGCPAQQSIAINMPTSWPLGQPWTFPSPWDASAPNCGCTRVTAAFYPGQPGVPMDQLGVFFPLSNTVACAPIGYFNRFQMMVGSPQNVNYLIQNVQSFGLSPVQPNYGYGYGYQAAQGYGVSFGMNYGPTNGYPLNNNQAFTGYGYGNQPRSGISDPQALMCMSRMVIGCDLATEALLNSRGQSQCGNGRGICVAAVPDQPQSTLGYCSYRMAGY